MRHTRGRERPPTGNPGRALVVGITGGIASGKTTVARELERLGASLIDADEVGHEVLDSSPEARAELVHAFGSSVLTPEGRVDRVWLGNKVFSDPGALASLNRIVHPRLLARVGSRIQTLRDRPEVDVIVIDAALLVEWKAEEWVGYLVVVEADPDLRIERLCRRNGLTRQQALGRMDAQVDSAARARVADEIVVNRGSVEDLLDQTRGLWTRLLALAAGDRAKPKGGS